MNISIGSYRNPRDRDAKLEAYKKLLQAQINLNKLSEQAFKDKRARGDAPYVPTPLERPSYSTQAEYLSDINEQERVAIQKTKELLPFGTEARTFVLETLRPRENVLDPLSETPIAIPRVVLYNQYFDRFVKQQLKGVSRLSPSSILRAWFDFIDGLTEDLLPKQSVIDSIKDIIKQMLRVSSPTPQDEKNAMTLLDILDTQVLTEGQLSNMKFQLEQNIRDPSVFNQLRQSLQTQMKPRVTTPIVPAVVVTPPVKKTRGRRKK